jgi:YesN/AraC family two-component response regulator
MIDFIALRGQLDYWRNRYARTHHANDYIKYSVYLKKYMRLIDGGNIPREVIEKIANTDNASKKDKKRKSLSAGRLSGNEKFRKTMRYKAPKSKEILSLFKNRKKGLSLQEIGEHIHFSHQYLREILRSLVSKGMLEEEQIRGRSVWRKRGRSVRF